MRAVPFETARTSYAAAASAKSEHLVQNTPLAIRLVRILKDVMLASRGLSPYAQGSESSPRLQLTDGADPADTCHGHPAHACHDLIWF